MYCLMLGIRMVKQYKKSQSNNSSSIDDACVSLVLDHASEVLKKCVPLPPIQGSIDDPKYYKVLLERRTQHIKMIRQLHTLATIAYAEKFDNAYNYNVQKFPKLTREHKFIGKFLMNNGDITNNNFTLDCWMSENALSNTEHKHLEKSISYIAGAYDLLGKKINRKASLLGRTSDVDTLKLYEPVTPTIYGVPISEAHEAVAFIVNANSVYDLSFDFTKTGNPHGTYMRAHFSENEISSFKNGKMPEAMISRTPPDTAVYVIEHPYIKLQPHILALGFLKKIIEPQCIVRGKKYDLDIDNRFILDITHQTLSRMYNFV